MPRNKKPDQKPIEQYDHKGKKRVNNPPVGLVTPETDKETGKKTYAYDPHLDPQLQWAEKPEYTFFEVPIAYRETISLPFEPGKNKRIAVKIVNDKGIESLKIMEVE
jgi:hypothetical protein